ncbi:hypothetical protein XENOCAPTIV_022035, partial [Xenoophorus captivus]
RYYGQSLPFGKESFNIPQVGLLTVEQALADYAIMISELKEQLAATDCPVIVTLARDGWCWPSLIYRDVCSLMWLT